MGSLLVEAARSPMGGAGLDTAEGFRPCVSPAVPKFSVLYFWFILGLLGEDGSPEIYLGDPLLCLQSAI